MSVFNLLFCIRDDDIDSLKNSLNSFSSSPLHIESDQLVHLYRESLEKNVGGRSILSTSLKGRDITNLPVISEFIRAKGFGEYPILEEPGTHKLLNPYIDLFIYSLLFNRLNSIKALIPFLNHPICGALFGVYILTKIIQKQSNNWMRQHAQLKATESREWLEGEAERLIEKLFVCDPQLAKDVIRQEMKEWGSMSCIQYALLSESKKIINHPAFLETQSVHWRHGTECSWLDLFLTASFLGIPVLFRPKLSNEIKEFRKTELGEPESSTCNSWLKFFSIPRVTFALNSLYHLFFIVSMAYILLFNFKVNFHWYEFVVIFCSISLFIDEFRQIYEVRKKCGYSLIMAVRMNKTELMAGLLYIASIVLRLISSKLVMLSHGLALTAFLFYISELTRCLLVNPTVGPTIVIINRVLTTQLFSLIGVLLGIGLVYGIITEAWLFHYQPNSSWSVSWGLLFRPLFQMFGEMSLSDLSIDCDNSEWGSPIAHDSCPSSATGVKVTMSAIHLTYITITNIVILNLFIAMISAQYVNPLEEWRAACIRVQEEYFTRPLFPPLLLVECLYHALQPATSKTSHHLNRLVNKSEKDKMYKMKFKLFDTTQSVSIDYFQIGSSKV